MRENVRYYDGTIFLQLGTFLLNLEYIINLEDFMKIDICG